MLLGVAGWTIIVATAFGAGSDPAVPVHTGMLSFVFFVAVIIAARSMAFRVTSHHVLSLDTAFYVASTMCLGNMSAGQMVAIALTIDSILRWALARRSANASSTASSLAYILYFGGMSGALLIACGWLFGVDHWMATLPSQQGIGRLVVSFAVTFLLLHYAIQGVRARLLGESWSLYLHGRALPGLFAEALVMPMGILLVLLFRSTAGPQPQRLGFILLCATYLVLHYVFSRLRRTSHDLASRVADLETLTIAGRRLAAALELEDLVAVLAEEIRRAVPSADAVVMHRGGDGDLDRLIVDRYDVGSASFTRSTMRRDHGIVGDMLRDGKVRKLDEVSAIADDYREVIGERAVAWLGVPIRIGSGPDGVLAVESSRRGAFGSPQARLLDAVGLAAGAALRNAQLYQMAMVDGLTGLFVRRYFDARIAEEFERGKRYRTPFAIVMIDVDDFKQLNDTHGHLAGDRVLREIAAVVKGQMRGIDTAVRYGGEELALILPGTDMLAAYAQAERIRGAIAGKPRAVSTYREVTVTASFGIAAFPEVPVTTSEELVRLADEALYRAKKMGKNRVELYWARGEGPPAVAT